MRVIFILIFLLTLLSCKTNKIAELRENTCGCFDSIKYDGDKLKFQMAEQRCVSRLYYGVLAIQSLYPNKSNFELNQIIRKELKEKCDSWNRVLTLYFQLSKQSTNTRIKNKSECEILKKGIFKDLTENNTFITIQDSIQITKNLDLGNYIKSKIKWLDSCTYQVMPFETNDSIMKRHLAEKPIFTLKIIEINKDTITYENEYKGDFSLGQYIKMN
jgi:hypothetical protein